MRRRMREFRPLAESAVVRIESLQNRSRSARPPDADPKSPRAPAKSLRLRHGADQRAGGLLDFVRGVSR